MRFTRYSKTFALAFALFLMGCSGASDGTDAPLPTELEFPTVTASLTSAASFVPSVTALPASPSVMPSETDTATPAISDTPLPTIPPTLTRTPDPTRAAEITATQVAIVAPIISTLTPIPPGSDSEPLVIPLVMADVVITEAQFQAELDGRLPDNPAIDALQADFISGEPSGVRISMRASGGEAMVRGDVFVVFQLLSGGVVAISVTDISVGSGEPPAGFVDIAQNDLFELVFESFDAILTRRLGEDHDLEDITFTDDAMQITLLIPE